jgi:PAS domain S-box-containing protein
LPFPLRLGQLQRDVAAAAGDPDRLMDLVHEIEIALQELDVVHEELQRQNEELLDTREELERQRHRYQDLFERTPYGYVVTDGRGLIEEANQTAEELLGTTGLALQGRPFFVFFTPADRPALRVLIPQLESGERLEREVVLDSRGKLVPVLLTAVRDLDSATYRPRLLWMLRDLSQTKKTEEALRESEERLRHSQRLESVGRLAGGIAHSFNNLLAAISFHSELLRERLGEGEGQSHVLAIQGAGERAATLARQLLAFGRKQVLQPQVLCLKTVIGELEPILQRLVGEDIQLTTKLSPQAGNIDADPGQIEQVLLNLVANARDAMPYGGWLTIGTEPAEVTADTAAGLDLPPGPYLKLWVKDSGIGMSQEVQSRLFEPFFTTKEKHKGTGLGLATVYGIVHQSGGGITVDSEPGKGACFSVYLPRSERPAAAGLERPAAAPLPARRAPQSSEVILLVEDEENIRTPAVEILESRGYQVLAAADASEALQTVAGYPEDIHLMITDVVMPGMSGGQLAERLAEERPSLKVVYISGYPEDAIAHHGVLKPEHVFLQKPFSPAALLTKVREVLDKAHAAAADRATGTDRAG